MGNLFADIGIDESLQYLFPDTPPESWYGEQTFDEEGELHSYNDMPIRMSDETWRNAVEFRWYSHGYIMRANNLPPIIIVGGRSYETFNEYTQLQSYNDLPSKIEVLREDKEVRFSWHADDELHRDDLLPAVLSYDSDGSFRGQSFYVDGRLHRSDNLPAETDVGIETWVVQGILHNTAGYAECGTGSLVSPDLFTWSLYGVEMPEEFFNSVMQLTADAGIPLYAAFLVSVRVITMEHLDAFIDCESGWKMDVPTLWVLRALNVTAENFSEKINEAALWNDEVLFSWNIDSADARFNGFLRVIASEEKDAAERLLQNL